MDTFLETVRSAIERHQMIGTGERVLVGVSGGPDSLALLSALVALRDQKKIILHAAYVDHGLRPAAARREAALVQRVGRMWGVPTHLLHRVVRKGKGESLESAARRLRYQALSSTARSHRCRVIAVGHTRDDQAETVLMWLIRGTGTTGLTGIPPIRRLDGSRIVRPLLDCSRSQVDGYLRSQGIQPMQDQTNRSLRFLRNRIRHELIPLVERRYNRQLRKHLAQLADILREDLGWLGDQLKEGFLRMARPGMGVVRLDRQRLRSKPAALRRGILRLAVERLHGNCHGFGSRHWIALDQLLLNGTHRRMDLPHGLKAEVSTPATLLLRSNR